MVHLLRIDCFVTWPGTAVVKDGTVRGFQSVAAVNKLSYHDNADVLAQ